MLFNQSRFHSTLIKTAGALMAGAQKTALVLVNCFLIFYLYRSL